MGQFVTRMTTFLTPSFWMAGSNAHSAAQIEERQQRSLSQDDTTVRLPYFGTHFLMGGELYDAAKPETFLFGDWHDLEIMGNKPVKFPYDIRGVSDTAGVLNAFVNIRRDSVKLVRTEPASTSYRVEFIFDADFPCSVQIHFCSRESVEGETVRIVSRYAAMKPSDRYKFDPGAGQVFRQYIYKAHRNDRKLMHYEGGHYFPLVIELRSSKPDQFVREQVHTTMCSIERSTDASTTLILKPMKQKLIVDGATYLLQEIYGIENKEPPPESAQSAAQSFRAELNEENSADCIICMASFRDTMILPCRHLCVCSSCAENLRHRLNNCPICRVPFKALVKFRTTVTRNVVVGGSGSLSAAAGGGGGPGASSTLGSGGSGRIRMRQETLTLLESINGPCYAPNSSGSSTPTPQPLPPPPARSSVVVRCKDSQQGSAQSSLLSPAPGPPLTAGGMTPSLVRNSAQRVSCFGGDHHTAGQRRDPLSHSQHHHFARASFNYCPPLPPSLGAGDGGIIAPSSAAGGLEQIELRPLATSPRWFSSSSTALPPFGGAAPGKRPTATISTSSKAALSSSSSAMVSTRGGGGATTGSGGDGVKGKKRTASLSSAKSNSTSVTALVAGASHQHHEQAQSLRRRQPPTASTTGSSAAQRFSHPAATFLKTTTTKNDDETAGGNRRGKQRKAELATKKSDVDETADDDDEEVDEEEEERWEDARGSQLDFDHHQEADKKKKEGNGKKQLDK